MILQRFDVPGLAHYSYAVGCEKTGQMAIVDPERNIERYLDFARRNGARVTHVLETHIHADYASGARELSEKTGAPVFASTYDVGETFTVAFPHTDVRDGDVFDLGSVRLKALHTPGHTPEHLAFLVYDLASHPDVPAVMLSGDFLFVGSLGRPDLLGEDQKLALARGMFRTVRDKLKGLPDSLEIMPAHGAGSMCGSGMSGEASSTLGAERLSNPYLDPTLDEDTFIKRLLGTVPVFPPYYRRMKRFNSEGHVRPASVLAPPALPVADFASRLEAGAVVIDTRDQVTFGAGHVPGAIGIGAGSGLAVWASWLVPYERPLLLVTRDAREAADAAAGLARVGLDGVVGHLQGGLEAWTKAGKPVAMLPQVSPRDLHRRLAGGEPITVVDVRAPGEWNAGHVEGAVHLFGGTITDHLGELPDKAAPVAVMCGGGYRSTAVASVLARHGFTNLLNVTGGMGAWMQQGLPTTGAALACAG